MLQFLTKFGLYNINIERREGVHIFPLVVKWQGILPKFIVIWALFPRNDNLAKIDILRYGIVTITCH